jgi:lipopolysaccharide/colanic/teichoic acid biosynthesis glycosyltransferase
MDVTGAGAGLVLTSPLLLAVGAAVRVLLGSPVLFKQPRPGQHGNIFQINKFRTMRDAVDANGVPLPDDQRLTRFGRLLRASSLDELPELLNVLKGDMSLVGPRPLLPEYLTRYNREQRRRHEVKPGITGWAQIHGRNSVTWGEKFSLDCWYVDNWSNELDMKILLLTVLAVLRRDGITHAGSVSMPKFMGNDQAAAAESSP